MPGCASTGEDGPTVLLETRACAGTPVLQGVRYLRWRVTGPDLEPQVLFTPVEEGAAGAPSLAGGGRTLEVRGYTELPRAGGRVVALGRADTVAQASGDGAARDRAVVRVVLRRVGEYAPLVDAQGKCLSLGTARAAHTATLLEDGRVLLAGGFALDQDGRSTTLGVAQVLDPAGGTLRPLPELNPARAFHTATRLSGGQVMLVGGETQTEDGPLPLRVAEVLDETGQASSRVEWARERSRHAAVVDSGGRVLVLGGVGEDGAVVAEAEGYDSATGRLFPVATPVPRVGMAAYLLGDGQRIAVVGGSDGTDLQPEVLVLAYQEDGFAPVAGGDVLREPRRDGALAAFGPSGRLVYVGGSSAPGETRTDSVLASSEFVFASEAPTAGATPQVFARSEPCAVTLLDGRVVVLGGRGFGPGGLVSDAHAELLVPGGAGEASGLLGMPNLTLSRYQHTCTVLRDGAVLVAGGVTDDGGERATLGDLFVYTPPPLD
ncbi:Kelch repeat-containing protein [Melittangium boletus]|uniref:Kelch repeat-containing protein n=1 Tax=Melittangium boletus TaxID=83453 RepID=UPI003DA4B722